MVLLQQMWGLQVACWFLCVVAFRVPFPLDQVLEVLLFPMTLVAPNGLNFALFFPSHEVRWGSGVVCAVFFCFDIRGKE
jgi:hypothetical protein